MKTYQQEVGLSLDMYVNYIYLFLLFDVIFVHVACVLKMPLNPNHPSIHPCTCC